MVFYKIDAIKAGDGEERELSRQENRARANEIAEKSEGFFQKCDQKQLLFMVSIKEDKITCGAICKGNENIDKLFVKYAKLLPFTIISFKTEEITFSALQSLLSCAERNYYIQDDADVFDAFEIRDLTDRYCDLDIGEAMINTQKERSQITETADNLLFSSTMLPEIERIYQNKTLKKTEGHPVHYMIQTDDREVRKSVYKNLLSALYANGRVKNQRYSFVDYCAHSDFPGATLDALYRSSFGGAVVVRYLEEENSGGQFGRRGHDIIAAICEIAYKYKTRVLTIICLPKSANETKDLFLANWGNTAFVELYEDVVFTEKAISYLKGKAKENKIRIDKNLLGRVFEDKGYTSAELNNIFEDWYSKKLRNEIYPQYKTAETAKAKIKDEKLRGSAYDRLQKLIGLKNAKDVMNKALNYFKVQKMFADKGLKNDQPSMHMVFTGNPGTAKTTVARLFAEIMKENGLVTNGDIYEVGRADLVGKYVGHTAPLVKAAFKRAKGGVLFIDEAYSLVDDRDGMYGDEAINTIVQEMENNRRDTIVIFAGYPDKMEEFLNKNPGLRSRIAFHIPFEDYNASELCEIAELIASEKGFCIEQGAKEKLSGIFELASKSSDFGNGRYARNIIEKAKMAQADRLINMDFEKITDKDVFTLVADDFELPLEKRQEKVIKIGFLRIERKTIMNATHIMYIKKIVIEKNDGITESYDFNDTVTTIRYNSDVEDIVKWLLGIHDFSEQTDYVHFYAVVEIDKIYTVYGSGCSDEWAYISVYKDNELGYTEEYFNLVEQNPELDSNLFFNQFKKQDYPHKLLKYKDLIKYYPSGDFGALTNGYGTTRSFRGFVTNYIKHFKPIRLRENKDMYLKLSKDGEFKVGYLDNDEDVFLSESENMLYHYLSFISIADFWARAERIRNLNIVIKPLVVSHFSEFLDENIMIDEMMRLSKKAGRQVILFDDK